MVMEWCERNWAGTLVINYVVGRYMLVNGWVQELIFINCVTAVVKIFFLFLP